MDRTRLFPDGMTRRRFLQGAGVAAGGVALASLLGGARVFGAEAQRRTNVVVILGDDLGIECIGAHGGESYSTPNIDRLAAGGVRFDYAYAQPLCTPTRVQLMTGQYNVRNYTNFGEMDPGERTVAQLFKSAGYATCIAGKWQLGGGFDRPKHFGFDEYCLWQLTRRPRRYANPGIETNGKAVNYRNGEYGPDITGDYLCDFIRRNREKPFLAYYPMILPHGPVEPTPDSRDYDRAFSGPEGGNGRREHFADMIAYMDKLVGRVTRTLEEAGVLENTLIVFSGDNGTDNQVSRFRGGTVAGGKGRTTDSGTHVPLVVSWPGATPKGTVCNDIVDFSDFLPTLCETAGIAVPADWTVDGRSFLPQVRGERGNPREWTYCWYSRNPPADLKEFARDKRYKLYRTGEFYDVTADRGEKEPLPAARTTGEAAAAREKLQAALDLYRDARPARSREKQRRGQGRGPGAQGEAPAGAARQGE